MAGTLSGGQQKMLGPGARASRSQPKLLMVDEPTEGLMPANVELITDALLDATQTGMTVLVVDSSLRPAAHAVHAAVRDGSRRADRHVSPERLHRARTSWPRPCSAKAQR